MIIAKWLPQEELQAVVLAQRADLLIGGILDTEYQTLTLIRGDYGSLRVRLSIFQPSGDGTVPEFEKFKLTDHGHTVKFGKYEAATEAVFAESKKIIDPCKMLVFTDEQGNLSIFTDAFVGNKLEINLTAALPVGPFSAKSLRETADEYVTENKMSAVSGTEQIWTTVGVTKAERDEMIQRLASFQKSPEVVMSNQVAKEKKSHGN